MFCQIYSGIVPGRVLSDDHPEMTLIHQLHKLLVAPLLTPLFVLEACPVDDLQGDQPSFLVIPYALRQYNYVASSPPSERTLVGDDESAQYNCATTTKEATLTIQTGSQYSESDVDESAESEEPLSCTNTTNCPGILQSTCWQRILTDQCR